MNSVIAAYGCNSLDKDIRYQSSSGGVFSVLATYFLKKGGVVYGTAMSDDCKEAVYQRVTDIEDLEKLRGSKYLQSKLGDTFKRVREDLQDGICVMFSGCPCQINGLTLFLGKEYDNLFCMDIICHGVPSPELWRKYTDYFETKNHTVLKRVNFRSKEQSWKDFGLMQETKLQSGSMKQWFSSRIENPYMMMFLKNYDLRPSCYECSSKSYRTADISIGDFWGIENVLPELNDSNGTSLVLIRTAQGMEIFEKVKGKIKFAQCEYEQATKKNTADYKSVVRPIQRDKFFLDMNRLSFDRLTQKYLESPMKRNIKRIVKKIMGHK